MLTNLGLLPEKHSGEIAGLFFEEFQTFLGGHPRGIIAAGRRAILQKKPLASVARVFRY